MDFNIERENNIVRNIAKEIVLECSQNGFEVPQELADYLVKLKLLNPKNGFTAAEVMPRSLTQQLVMLVVEDLKQQTPAMNCLRMQVYWNSLNLNIAKLKAEYIAQQAEKAETYLGELLVLDKEDINTMFRSLAYYILVVQNLGSINHVPTLKETIAAIHSVWRNRHINTFLSSPEDQRVQKVKELTKRVTGIRLFLKATGRAGEGIEDIKNLTTMIEHHKEEISRIANKIATRISEIEFVIPNIVAIDYLFKDPSETADVTIPLDFDANDLKHLKQIHAIMLQHEVYNSDIASKVDEIDGDVSFCMNKLNEVLERLQSTIQDRDTIPTVEIYEDFTRAGELWAEIFSYSHCLEVVASVVYKLQEINKKDYFTTTPLEKLYIFPQKQLELKKPLKERSMESARPTHSSILMVGDTEDFHLEFSGFCAWTFYFAEGYLLPGSPIAGYYQYNDQFYAFATKTGQEMWSKDPYYYLMRIYEYLRVNPELIGLLNVYETLYHTKYMQLEKKTGKKVASRTANIQTVVHPIEKNWDKDYTFSEWELKKRALLLSRLCKCVTKSVQTVNHSHFRSSIGVTASPDKDKNSQTKRDNACNHPAISSYLYGLRGHRENKFKVLTLTRPIDEEFQREIILERVDPCKARNAPPVQVAPSEVTTSETILSLGGGCSPSGTLSRDEN